MKLLSYINAVQKLQLFLDKEKFVSLNVKSSLSIVQESVIHQVPTADSDDTLLIQTIENSMRWIEFSVFLGLLVLEIKRFLLKSNLIE